MFTAPQVLGNVAALLLMFIAAAAGAIAGARLQRNGPGSSRAAAALAGALVASTLVVAPMTAWSIASDARAAHRLSTREADRLGVEQSGADTTLTDRAAAIIPAGSTYALVLSDEVDADQALVFRLWSLSAMLPRIAVVDPLAADWVMSWGRPPRALGLRVTRLHVLVPHAGSGPPMYVARVSR